MEPLVNRDTEHYPRGGMKYLVCFPRTYGATLKPTRVLQANGLDMLRKAGIQAILDHHALPGVQVANQMFTGKCVLLFDRKLQPGISCRIISCTSTPQFYVGISRYPAAPLSQLKIRRTTITAVL